MADHSHALQTLKAAAVTGVVGGVLVIGAIALVPSLGSVLGKFESNWIEARLPAVAKQAEEKAAAIAVVERETAATRAAIDVDREIAMRQTSDIHSSNWTGRIMANASSFACSIYAIGDAVDPGRRTQLDGKGFCRAADNIRGEMVGNYSEHLDKSQSSRMDRMIARFRETQEAGR